MPAPESPKFRTALERLPNELRDVFERLVKEYAYLTEVRYGRGYVAYEVLADLVLAGWRPSAASHPESKL